MYCPKCAAQNLDDAKFCRACGADISLVPQALTGRPAATTRHDRHEERRLRRQRGETPTIEHGVVQMFLGLAFVVVALALSRPGGGGDNWWFYMLIPAFVFLGKGVGTLARISQERKKAVELPVKGETTAQLSPPQRVSALPPRDTGELIAPPPSVTEATTRHLGVPVNRKPKDV